MEYECKKFTTSLNWTPTRRWIDEDDEELVLVPQKGGDYCDL